MPKNRDPSMTGRAAAGLWAIFGVCCALPIAWMLWQVISHPEAWSEARPDAFRVWLIGRTLLYNAAAAVLATLLALPVAVVLGRGRGWAARLAWGLLPLGLFIPSIVYTYGWKQVFRLMHVEFIPASGPDIARCVWTLASWLWPVCAGWIGLSLRHADTGAQQAAILDGAYWRVSARLLAGPILAGFACCTLLAMQEFSVYEPTGISVVATEVRMVFDTGAMSAGQPAGPAMVQSVASDMAPSSANPATGQGQGPSSQGSRAAAAIVTGAPLLLIVGLLGLVVLAFSRNLGTDAGIDPGPWPRALDASPAAHGLAYGVLGISLLVPLTGLVLSLHRQWDMSLVWSEFGHELVGSLLLALCAGALALIVGLLATASRPAGVLGLGIAGFLVGGQFLAIAQIHLYNRTGLGWVYNSPAILLLTYMARFGWVALLVGRSTWTSAWKALRDCAAVDGADARQTTRRVIAPLAYPLLLSAGLLVAVLCIGEVPATVLIQPLRPPMLVPLMMTWVHNLRFDPMIEASLALVGVVMALAVVMLLLWRVGRKRLMGTGSPGVLAKASGSGRAHRVAGVVLVTALCSFSGCRPSSQPKEIWAEPGKSNVALVYPRAICRSPVDNAFFVVDRTATIYRLDPKGKYLNSWRMPAWEHGKPVGLSAGPDGNLYVPDTHYHRVIVYTPQGQELRRWGSEGTGPGQFVFPTDVAFDANGNVYVSEYGDHDRVQVFDGSGKYLREFGKFGNGPGEFSRPQSMVIDGEQMFITDACNHRLVVFKLDGTFVRSMGSVGDAPGQYRFPYGLDKDQRGNLIVCEFGNNRVQKIDTQTGKCLGLWGTPGHEPGQLAYPWAVVVDAQDRVITVDSGNNRLQVIGF